MASPTTRTLPNRPETGDTPAPATDPLGTHEPVAGPSARPVDHVPARHSRDRRLRIGLPLLVWALGAIMSTTATEAASGPVEPSSVRPSAARVRDPRTTMRLETRYDLVTSLHYDAARLDVTETVSIVNRSSGAIDGLHLSVLARAYGEFRLESVRVDGRSTRVTFPNRADMLVTLPAPLSPGAQATLVIRFTDHPSADASDSLRARLSKADGMMRVADWYPILSDGHGLRNPGDSQFTAAATSVTLDLTTDRPLTIAAPGKLKERDGRRRVYRLDDARNYGFVVAPHLKTLSTTTRDGVRVRVFQPVGVDGRRALRETRRALERYDDAYGPYPWPELIVAPSPGGWIATEWPSIVFLGTDGYTDADVIHHEVAHQWFYALMGSDQLREPWVDEAFALFSERHFFGGWQDWSFCSGKPVDSAVYAFPDTLDRWGCGSYVETVYIKGAAMIDGVRTRMGDRAFFASIRGLLADHRFGLVSGRSVVQAWLDRSQDPKALITWLRRFLGRKTLRGMTRSSAARTSVATSSALATSASPASPSRLAGA